MEKAVYMNKCSLTNEDISRYSRQLILPEIGVTGQLKLKHAKVLIVGMGGLGCPAALYLAGAGVGTLGLLDYDDVDKSNLHRQVLHNEDNLGISKVSSAAQYIKRLNSSVHCIEYHMALDSAKALEIIEGYDIVIDGSDNVTTRYLVNDACVLSRKVLVSGSALRFEGQLTIYNYKDGPCYRCLYPKPPPAESVTNCSDGGVIGAVTGMIGSLQALETIKILSGIKPAYYKKLLVFDGLSGEIRIVRLRSKKEDCPVCGLKPSISTLQDYEALCGASATDKCVSISLLSKDERISVEQYKNIVDQREEHLLIDVRPEVEFDICSFAQAKNFPTSRFSDTNEVDNLLRTFQSCSQPVYVICRQGNDSQMAVLQLKNGLERQGCDSSLIVKDISGGLAAWSAKIDSTFPVY